MKQLDKPRPYVCKLELVDVSHLGKGIAVRIIIEDTM